MAAHLSCRELKSINHCMREVDLLKPLAEEGKMEYMRMGLQQNPQVRTAQQIQAPMQIKVMLRLKGSPGLRRLRRPTSCYAHCRGGHLKA
eukprot:1159364-Pelagomonas_calceolata.AAC.9